MHKIIGYIKKKKKKNAMVKKQIYTYNSNKYKHTYIHTGI